MPRDGLRKEDSVTSDFDSIMARVAAGVGDGGGFLELIWERVTTTFTRLKRPLKSRTVGGRHGRLDH